jgi:ubiquinol-cytochrome c reductase iron-sulfur subunit
MALRKGAQLFGSRLLPSVSSSVGSLSTVPAVLSDAVQSSLLSDAAQFGQQRREAHATTDITNSAAASGLPPTVFAAKNPTNIIQYDEHVHDRFPVGDPSKRAFTYFVLTSGRFVYASALRLAVLKLILSMTATKDVLAMAALEVDLSKIEMGQTVTVKWRGKPVFVRRRSEQEVEAASKVDLKELRDPEPDSDRATNPEWLVVVGVCTHLGCVPLPNAGDWHGWFCPCHGSHYDTSGRVRKGPAPYNLEVPEYKFLDENTLQVG